MLLNIIIEKDRDRYFARILELEGCVSQGNTYEEALKRSWRALFRKPCK